jgi:hypothetical protein
MGLFVISRLAHRHGIEVRLFPASPGSRGITAEVYLPSHLLVERAVEEPAPMVTSAGPAPLYTGLTEPESYQQYQPDEPAPYEQYERYEPEEQNEPDQPYAPDERYEEPTPGPVVSLLPRRTPGSSGITGVPAGQPVQVAPSEGDADGDRARRELPQPWWEADEQAGPPAAEHGAQQVPNPEPVAEKSSPSDTSAYFAARARAESAVSDADTDTIYQRMLSESVGNDPNEAGLRADLDWQSVWDRGWSVAAEAENMPVAAHTEHGLPVREPGARLVPGSAGAEAPSERPDGPAHHHDDTDEPVASNGGPNGPGHEVPERDPAAIRASISSHFGGVHAARSHARESGPENALENGLDTDQGQNRQ